MPAQPQSFARPAPALPRSRARLALQPLDLSQVRLTPRGALGAWQELNAIATIPHCVEQLETSGVLDNFRRLHGETEAPHRGFVFADSDLFKVIEAVAWEIGRSGTTAHDGWLDEMVALVERTQEEDGYLHTWVQGVHPEKKFAELHWTHEMYVLGHWLQAGIALARTAARTDLLDLALRFVDLVASRFGPDGEDGIPGHPEIETALVELYRLTGEQRHLTLAQHLVDQRGRGILPGGSFGGRYYQDHLPVREATDPTGHAVRQLYLNAGVTDLFLETGEEALADVMREQWDRAHTRKMYLSGAFGSRHRDESFGNDHELPSDRAYAETCATIADLHWTWRMMLAGHDRRHADVIEREIHNALAASIDASGTRFFYSNPLQRRPDRFSEENAPAAREPWYSCACCPPNIARTVAQLGAYIAGVRLDGDGATLEILQLADVSISLPAELGAGTVHVDTSYPDSDTLRLRTESLSAVDGARLGLRIPGWVRSGTLALTGDPERPLTAEELAAQRLELPLDRVDGAMIVLDMPPRWTTSHPRVDATRGCVALERGPLIHCLEQVDMPDGIEVDDLLAPAGARVHAREDGTLELTLLHRPDGGALYRSAEPAAPVGAAAHEVTVRAPRFSRWGNRGPGAMRIWIPSAP